MRKYDYICDKNLNHAPLPIFLGFAERQILNDNNYEKKHSPLSTP